MSEIDLRKLKVGNEHAEIPTSPNDGVIPSVIETTAKGDRAVDVFSRLVSERIVFIGEPITEEVANNVIAQLLHLDNQDPTKEISIYINSPGGSVYDGLAIYDTIQYLKSDVRTICVGKAMSMGSLLLAAGTPGKRMALPNARIMIHQPSGGFKGQETDIVIQANETTALKKRLYEIYSQHTGEDMGKLYDLMERDNFMGPEQAKAIGPRGLIDQIVMPEKTKQLPAPVGRFPQQLLG